MQQTQFDYEIIIHDDASTDGTSDIIREYVAKHPGIIFPLIQEENQYSKLGGGMLVRFNYPRCRGKYIALCEGDDYWTDPLKLQRQVDFLESHPDFSLCGHQAVKIDEKGNELGDAFLVKKDVLDFDDVAVRFRPIPTSSLMFRNNLVFPEWYYRVYGGDRACLFLNAQKGKIKILDFRGSVYRIHEGGVEQRFKRSKFALPLRSIHEDSVYFQINSRLKHKMALAKRIIKSHLYVIYWSMRHLEFSRFFKTAGSLLRFVFFQKLSI